MPHACMHAYTAHLFHRKEVVEKKENMMSHACTLLCTVLYSTAWKGVAEKKERAPTANVTYKLALLHLPLT
jgi:hypothetical protein